MQDTLLGYWEQGRNIALDWITSPPAYAQFGLLVASFLLALLVSRRLSPRLASLIDPGTSETRIADLRRFAMVFLPRHGPEH